VKTLFVTGAEGFTGKHLVEYLGRRGYDVIGGVRNRARKLAFERQYGKALVCDVSDAINVARAVASVKPDGIIHLAGTSQPHAANAEPLAAYQSIVTGWANVVDAVRRVVPRARVLLASACEVYGNAGADGRPLNEDTPLAPTNTFGSLKATAESIARTFFLNYHTNITVVRPFHYTGTGQSEYFFFGAVAKRLAEWNSSTHGDDLQLPDLDFKRDLLHVVGKFLEFFVEESCGYCTPCRVGNVLLRDRLSDVRAGKGTPADLEYLGHFHGLMGVELISRISLPVDLEHALPPHVAFRECLGDQPIARTDAAVRQTI